jgi:DNA-directed RNA polymerase subunit RPC12/RpoP
MVGICPKCKKEIDELIYIETGATNFYKVILQGEDVEFDLDETNSDGENWYQCPECEQEVCRESEEVEKEELPQATLF